MATATTTRELPPPAGATETMSHVKTNRTRRVTAEAGHALEILGHAIEYLMDEFVHEGGVLTQHSPQLEAVQLLMSLNRQVYFECPEIVPFKERFRVFLHHHFVVGHH